jgi:hypothetical protein
LQIFIIPITSAARADEINLDLIFYVEKGKFSAGNELAVIHLIRVPREKKVPKVIG